MFKKEHFIILMLLTILLVPSLANMIFNNVRLSIFANALYQYPAPPGTEVINKNSSVGLLVGNGNHCDFQASVRYATDLSQDQIEEYYKDVRLPSVFSFSGKDYGGIFYGQVSLWFEGMDKDGKLRYVASIIDVGYPAWFDVRCH